jgi:hypothetical protein
VRYSELMARAWKDCDEFNQQEYQTGTRLVTLESGKVIENRITFKGPAFVLPDGSCVICCNESSHNISIFNVIPDKRI